MHGDGTADLGEDVQFDAIIVTAGTTHVPTGLLKHLKPGGRMVLPLAQHGEHGDGVQRLTVITAAPDGSREQTFDAVRFVPLLTGLA
jgi:protein-L-isoaspartate(D-aspartate) O-methyltransferase